MTLRPDDCSGLLLYFSCAALRGHTFFAGNLCRDAISAVWSFAGSRAALFAISMR
jgi:hypothetical protein